MWIGESIAVVCWQEFIDKVFSFGLNYAFYYFYLVPQELIVGFFSMCVEYVQVSLIHFQILIQIRKCVILCCLVMGLLLSLFSFMQLMTWTFLLLYCWWRFDLLSDGRNSTREIMFWFESNFIEIFNANMVECFIRLIPFVTGEMTRARIQNELRKGF